MFKIGTTVEADGTVAVIAVPAAWEHNGSLFWPKHLKESKINKMRKDPTSVPDQQTWAKQDFTVKATAMDFSAASKMENVLSSFPDTDAEEKYMAERKLNRRRPGYIQQQSQVTNYDELFLSTPTSSKVNSTVSNQYTPSKICLSAEKNSQLIMELPSQIEETNNESFTLNNLLQQCDHEQKFNELKQMLLQCIDSNLKINVKIDNLQSTIDSIQRKIGVSDAALVNDDDLDSFKFPISSMDELNALESKLKQDQKRESNLISKFITIAGDSGRQTASKVGVKIVERIISPHLLTQFTWTGRSNSQNTKMAFMKYTSIFNVCTKIISKADNRFNSEECEKFFKTNLLKHSSLRLSRKRKKDMKDDPGEVQVQEYEEYESLSIEGILD